MVDKQVTIMVLKVDLQCHRCYKKVKKVLCKFPQIQEQVYDEKQNTVTIKVVCCNPEKIKQKIFCQGGVSIKDIKDKKPPPPPPPQRKPDPPPPPPEIRTCCRDCSEGRPGGPCFYGCGRSYYASRCDYYFSEENPWACAIM